ncbi:hypothetical protein ES703_121798 [subsurface metagenome]
MRYNVISVAIHHLIKNFGPSEFILDLILIFKEEI